MLSAEDRTLKKSRSPYRAVGRISLFLRCAPIGQKLIANKMFHVSVEGKCGFRVYLEESFNKLNIRCNLGLHIVERLTRTDVGHYRLPLFLASPACSDDAFS